MLSNDVQKITSFLIDVKTNTKSDISYLLDQRRNELSIKIVFHFNLTYRAKSASLFLQIHNVEGIRSYTWVSTGLDTTVTYTMTPIPEILSVLKNLAQDINDLDESQKEKEPLLLPTILSERQLIKINNLIDVLKSNIQDIQSDISTVQRFCDKAELTREDMEFLNEIYIKHTKE